jgi:hypothetical protein
MGIDSPTRQLQNEFLNIQIRRELSKLWWKWLFWSQLIQFLSDFDIQGLVLIRKPCRLWVLVATDAGTGIEQDTQGFTHALP